MTPTKTKKTTKVAEAGQTKDAGTQRWPKNAVQEGQWIQLPKVVLKRMGEMGLEPRHLWLLLVLQSERYRNRPPRFYWEELAGFCGKNRNSVRKWAYELKAMGMLEIRQMRKLNPGEERRPGHRNERNEFLLGKFEARIQEEQEKLNQTRRRKRKGSTKAEQE